MLLLAISADENQPATESPRKRGVFIIVAERFKQYAVEFSLNVPQFQCVFFRKKPRLIQENLLFQHPQRAND